MDLGSGSTCTENSCNRQRVRLLTISTSMGSTTQGQTFASARTAITTRIAKRRPRRHIPNIAASHGLASDGWPTSDSMAIRPRLGTPTLKRKLRSFTMSGLNCCTANLPISTESDFSRKISSVHRFCLRCCIFLWYFLDHLAKGNVIVT